MLGPREVLLASLQRELLALAEVAHRYGAARDADERSVAAVVGESLGAA